MSNLFSSYPRFPMRLFLISVLAVLLVTPVTMAQSISDDLPSEVDGSTATTAPVPPSPPLTPNAETFTVTDINADVTADNAAHARDQALIQAEHAAFTQLCTKMGAPDSAAKIDDAALDGLVQSFEVQSEKASSVRYIGVFTIRFKPISTQKRLGKATVTADMGTASANGASTPATPNAPAKIMPQGPLSQITIAVQAESLPAWMQIKRRINLAPQVATIDTLDVGRGLSHINLNYAGSILDLQQSLSEQGLILRQMSVGIWELYDGSMVPR